MTNVVFILLVMSTNSIVNQWRMLVMRKNTVLLTIACLGLMVLVICGCDLQGNATGKLQLSISEGITRSMLVPDIEMKVTKYSVTGDGPGDASFGPLETTGDTLPVSDLAIGDWTIRVLGKNSEDIVIGQGTATVKVLRNETTRAMVVVNQIDGTGTLEIAFSWPVGAVENPVVAGQLVSEDKLTTFDLVFVPGDPGTAFSQVMEVPDGYYDLTLSLSDGDTFLVGRYCAVWIVADCVTEGTFVITSEDLEFTSALDILIDNQIHQPYGVELSADKGEVLLGEAVVIQATVVPENADYIYSWYVNGQIVMNQNESQIELGNGLGTGKYQVDVRIWNDIDHVISSATISFKVVELMDNAVIRGASLFADKDGHEGIVVRAIGQDVDFTTETDSFGNFMLENLPEGDFIIEASYPNYYPTSTRVTAINDEDIQILDQLILYPIEQFGTVEGNAYFIDRLDHSGIAVNVRTLAGQELPDLIALTNTDGSFRFENVPVDGVTGEATYVFTAFAVDNTLGYANDSITGRVTNNTTFTTDDLWLRPEAVEAIIFADDINPWESPALEEMLRILNVNYTIHASTDMSTLPLPIDKTVWIINDQPQSFYNAYAASQSRFDEFVENGGTLLFEACDSGWNSGSLKEAGATLPGSVNTENEFHDNNTNVNPTHPMMENVDIALVGSRASHNYFTSLPENATILCENENGWATLVEYKVGLGRVIATGQPLEFHWAQLQNPRQIYPNMIFYTFDLPFEDVFQDEVPNRAPRAMLYYESSASR